MVNNIGQHTSNSDISDPYISVEEKLISKITFPSGDIEFITDSNRVDSGIKLNKIKVKDNKAKVIKETRFEYDWSYA